MPPRRLLVAALTALCVVASFTNSARADGGTLRFRKKIGSCQLSVFTEPTTLRAGPVDFSVLVQDAEGNVVRDATVSIQLSRADSHEVCIEAKASHATATNKLLQAASIELPESGAWDVDVRVVIDGETTEAHFGLVAAPPLSRWVQLWPWFTLLVVVILCFVAHQLLVWNQKKRRKD